MRTVLADLKRIEKRAAKSRAKWSTELDAFIRRMSDRPRPSPQQRAVLEIIYRFARGAGEPCPTRLIARCLKLHHSTVEEHIRALRRKGWLRPQKALRGASSYPVLA